MTRAVQIAELGDQNTFSIDGDNNRVGIGSTQPTVQLDVTGDGNVSGTLTATSFSGDGTGLTGVASTDNIITGTAATFTSDVNIIGVTTVGILTAYTSVTVGTAITADAASGIVTATGVNVTGVVTATTFLGNVTGDVTGNVTGNATGLSGTPDITIRNVTGVAATFTGVLTYEDVTNIDSVGLVTARTGIKVLAGGINAVGVVTGTTGVQVGAGQSFGANGPTAVYYGDGSNLTGIAAGITTTKYSPTANAIIQIGLGTAQHHELTLSAGFTTITTSGGSFGESHSLVLIQPSSGIATVGFSTFFQFPSGATPSMSEGSSKVDLVSFVVKDIAGNTGTGATELLASAGLNYS
tara:strand:+ start:31 stop:1089 length:1059 start_codon:yes stop_codon:yes gene_type:complete